MVSTKFKGFVFFLLLRILLASWKVSVIGRENLEKLYKDNKPFLAGFWHGKYAPVIPILKNYNAAIISSDSLRGSIIGEICRRFGYSSVLLSDHPNREAFNQLEKIFYGFSAVGTAFDGPLGPLKVVKPGIIFMAARFKLAVLPVSVASSRKITFRNRWDNFEIPLPFAKVALVFGDPVHISPELKKIEIRAAAAAMGRTMVLKDKIAEETISK